MKDLPSQIWRYRWPALGKRSEYDAYAVSGRRESGGLINGACSSPSWSPPFCGTPVVEPAKRGSFAPVLSSPEFENNL